MVSPLAVLPVGSHALYLTRGPLEPALCPSMLCLLCALSVNCKQLSQGSRVPKSVHKQPGKRTSVPRLPHIVLTIVQESESRCAFPADDSSVLVLGGVGA